MISLQHPASGSTQGLPMVLAFFGTSFALKFALPKNHYSYEEVFTT